MAKTLYSLKGATVTVPDGWTSISKYGQYKIIGNLDGTTVSDTNTYNFLIGYANLDTPASDSVSFKRSDSQSIYAQRLASTGGFSMTITGGKDVQNQTLIKWFTDNNATIEGGIWLEEGFTIKTPLVLMLGEPMSTKFYDYDLRVNAENVEVIDNA